MTLANDLEILTGSKYDAFRIANDISAVAGKHEAYEILIGLAQRANIGLVRALALLMKYEAESAAHCEESAGYGEHCRALLDRPQELYCVFAAIGKSELETIEASDFITLLNEMSLFGLERVRTDSAALQYIADQWREIGKQLAEADQSIADKFVAAKKRWIGLNQKLQSLSIVRNEIADRAERLQREFLAIFSDGFLEAQAARSRLEIARMRLEILRENPGASAATIEQIITRRINERADALRPDQMVASAGFRFMSSGNIQSAEKDYKRAVSALRKLAMLIHPDRLVQIDLGWPQQEQLKAIWRVSNRYRAQRDNFKALAQAAGLIERQLQLAEQILALSGIDDLDASLAIQGVTLEDQIDWLETMNALLAPQLVSAQVEVHFVGNHPELNYFQAMINAPRQVQDEERDTLISNAERYHQKSEEIERATESLLSAYA